MGGSSSSSAPLSHPKKGPEFRIVPIQLLRLQKYIYICIIYINVHIYIDMYPIDSDVDQLDSTEMSWNQRSVASTTSNVFEGRTWRMRNCLTVARLLSKIIKVVFLQSRLIIKQNTSKEYRLWFSRPCQSFLVHHQPSSADTNNSVERRRQFSEWWCDVAIDSDKGPALRELIVAIPLQLYIVHTKSIKKRCSKPLLNVIEFFQRKPISSTVKQTHLCVIDPRGQSPPWAFLQPMALKPHAGNFFHIPVMTILWKKMNMTGIIPYDQKSIPSKISMINFKGLFS